MAALEQTNTRIARLAAQQVSCVPGSRSENRSDFLRPDPGTRWIAIVLSTLLAFLGQSFITQTHVHAASATGWTVAAGISSSFTALKTGQSTPDVPACPICQEITHAGSYLAPALVAFYSCELGPVWRVFPLSLALAPSRFSHAWRSRAPPGLLQA